MRIIPFLITGIVALGVARCDYFAADPVVDQPVEQTDHDPYTHNVSKTYSKLMDARAGFGFEELTPDQAAVAKREAVDAYNEALTRDSCAKSIRETTALQGAPYTPPMWHPCYPVWKELVWNGEFADLAHVARIRR